MNCTGPSSDECTNCPDASNHRIWNGVNRCPCDVYYYNTGVTMCTACHYSWFHLKFIVIKLIVKNAMA